MKAACLLGIDIGTTGSKAVLIDSNGDVQSSVTTEYSIYTPRPGWTEQNPEDWWNATKKSIRCVLLESDISPHEIVGIGLTGQMHGLVILDDKGVVLRPCIMWNDQRTATQCTEIISKIGFERLLGKTGKPALTGFTAGKILWVHENEPAIYRKIAHVLLPKDYVRYRLTGTFLTDVADASGTNLFNVGRRKWSVEIMDILEIPHVWLPEVTESAIVSSHVNAEAAAEAGLIAGTPVVGGAGDQAAQSIGTGIISSGIVSVTIGTSGVVFAVTDSYLYDKTGRLHAYCHAVPGKWHLMGVMLAAGGSFRWYRDVLCEVELTKATATGSDAYDILTAAAAVVPPGSEGLLFLPYLSGERTPYPDPNARGVFFGLSLCHTKPHLTRAVVEGVTYGLKDSLRLLCELGIKFDRVRISGGGARSQLWRQIMADVFNVEIIEVNTTESAAYGAALLAGVGIGFYENVEAACQRTIRETGSTRPGPAASIYADYYERYRALYPVLKEEFKKLSSVLSRHHG